MQAVLPLWHEDRRALADEVLSTGYRARVVCVDARWLDASYCGVDYDAAFLARLPEESMRAERTENFIPSCTTDHSLRAGSRIGLRRCTRCASKRQWSRYFIAELACT